MGDDREVFQEFSVPTTASGKTTRAHASKRDHLRTVDSAESGYNGRNGFSAVAVKP